MLQNVTKQARLAVMVTGFFLCLGLIFALWSIDYGLAVWKLFKSKSVMQSLGEGDIFRPFEMLLANWNDPAAQKVNKLSGLLLLMEVTAIGGLIAYAFLSRRDQPKGSRLATFADLEKGKMLDGKPGLSLLLGRYKGKEVRYSGASHILVNGPTRSGKGVGFVLPNAQQWQGSLVVFDMKREVFDEVGAVRRAMLQPVFMFAPGSRESHRWNPLDFIRPWPERATDLSNLARSIIPVSKEHGSHWSDIARNVFAGVLGYVCDSELMEGRRTLRSALRMFSTGEDVAVVMAKIAMNETDLKPFILDKFKQFYTLDKKQRPSYIAHITKALDPWNSELVDAVTSCTDIPIADLRRRPMTISVGVPVGDIGTMKMLIRLFVEQIHTVLLRNLPGKDEPHQVLVILDEFYQYGETREITDATPLVAGFGLRIAFVLQGISSLDVVYGKDMREMVLGNCDIKLFLAIGDTPTAKYVSQRLGKYWVRNTSWGEAREPGKAGSRNHSWKEREIQTEAELEQLANEKAILLSRSLPGLILDKVTSYNDKDYLKVKDHGAGFDGFILIPTLAAAPEWPVTETKAEWLSKGKAEWLAKSKFEADVSGAEQQNVEEAKPIITNNQAVKGVMKGKLAGPIQHILDIGNAHVPAEKVQNLAKHFETFRDINQEFSYDGEKAA